MAKWKVRKSATWLKNPKQVQPFKIQNFGNVKLMIDYLEAR